MGHVVWSKKQNKTKYTPGNKPSKAGGCHFRGQHTRGVGWNQAGAHRSTCPAGSRHCTVEAFRRLLDPAPALPPRRSEMLLGTVPTHSCTVSFPSAPRLRSTNPACPSPHAPRGKGAAALSCPRCSREDRLTIPVLRDMEKRLLALTFRGPPDSPPSRFLSEPSSHHVGGPATLPSPRFPFFHGLTLTKNNK